MRHEEGPGDPDGDSAGDSREQAGRGWGARWGEGWAWERPSLVSKVGDWMSLWCCLFTGRTRCHHKGSLQIPKDCGQGWGEAWLRAGGHSRGHLVSPVGLLSGILLLLS